MSHLFVIIKSLYVYVSECPAIGLQDGLLGDDAFGSTPIESPSFAAHMARLNTSGAWMPAANDEHQFLQVQLGNFFTLTKIATQGSPDSEYWVTKYKLRTCSITLGEWTFITDETTAAAKVGH